MSSRRLGGREEAFFMKRLSFLLEAGMPLTDALTLLGSQLHGTRVRAAIAGAAESIAAGQTLAASLERTGLVGAFSIAVIGVGEASGSLAPNLHYLAHELASAATLRNKIIGALMYPAVIAVATIMLTGGLVLFIFPKIVPVFAGLSVSLPLSTRLVLALSDYLRAWGLVTGIVAAGVGIALVLLVRRVRTVRLWSEAVLHYTPLLGPLYDAYALATLTRILALLLQSGMPLREALTHARSTVRSERHRGALAALADAVERGVGLGAPLRALPHVFPSLVAHMTQVGESSGSLLESLAYLATYYAEEVEEQTRRITALVEPALMIAMGSIVGFVAISMITPMYEITQHLNAR
ncbi:MAG TPA: type II secretion system F family protein [Candidatus Paceibacterota bacterium]|nr:type II secretion system F family protein [Candidatus Paceibacterota bacterium]